MATKQQIAKIKQSSYTLSEFLDAYHLSRTDLQVLTRQRRGPKTHKFARRLYVAFEAAELWRQEMEKELSVLEQWHRALQEDDNRMARSD